MPEHLALTAGQCQLKILGNDSTPEAVETKSRHPTSQWTDRQSSSVRLQRHGVSTVPLSRSCPFKSARKIKCCCAVCASCVQAAEHRALAGAGHTPRLTGCPSRRAQHQMLRDVCELRAGCGAPRAGGFRGRAAPERPLLHYPPDHPRPGAPA